MPGTVAFYILFYKYEKTLGNLWTWHYPPVDSSVQTRATASVTDLLQKISKEDWQPMLRNYSSGLVPKRTVAVRVKSSTEGEDGLTVKNAPIPSSFPSNTVRKSRNSNVCATSAKKPSAAITGRGCGCPGFGRATSDCDSAIVFVGPWFGFCARRYFSSGIPREPKTASGIVATTAHTTMETTPSGPAQILVTFTTGKR